MATSRVRPRTWRWTGVAAGSAVCGALIERWAATRTSQVDPIADDTAARIAHHLRTPLTSIINYNDAVLTGGVGPLSPDQRRLLGTVDRNADLLNHTIADLLAVLHHELGASRRGFEPVELGSVVERAVLDLPSAGERSNVRFDPPGEPMTAMGDTPLLVRMVRHLITNAVKFSSGGELVDVDLCRSGGAAELRVTDRGIGVPAGEVHLLAEPFFRSSRSRRQELPGLGLGLTVTKSIVELHHGSIQIEPAHDGGTTVTVRLPGVNDGG